MGATLHGGVRASHCGGFSCCGAQALGTWASVVVADGLSSCGMWDLPRPGLEPMSPALAGEDFTFYHLSGVLLIFFFFLIPFIAGMSDLWGLCPSTRSRA